VLIMNKLILSATAMIVLAAGSAFASPGDDQLASPSWVPSGTFDSAAGVNGNVMNVFQNGGNNFAGYYAQMQQSSPGGNNVLSIDQDGNDKADLKQATSVGTNLATFVQEGTGSYASINQSANIGSNVGRIEQGYNDTASVTQTSSLLGSNQAAVFQFDNNNTASITQASALGNKAYVVQTGGSNHLNVWQH
jgi:hypothetical protein